MHQQSKVHLPTFKFWYNNLTSTKVYFRGSSRWWKCRKLKYLGDFWHFHLASGLSDMYSCVSSLHDSDTVKGQSPCAWHRVGIRIRELPKTCSNSFHGSMLSSRVLSMQTNAFAFHYCPAATPWTEITKQNWLFKDEIQHYCVCTFIQGDIGKTLK